MTLTGSRRHPGSRCCFPFAVVIEPRNRQHRAGRRVVLPNFVIERQAIHRGTFRSVRELNAKIRAFIDGWNDRCHPFVWTKTAEEILKRADPKKTSATGH